MKKFDIKKIFKILKTLLNIILIVFVAAFVLMVCLQRFSENKISFFNYRLFTVISGSMEPKYKIGDVLISKEVKPDKIKVGDTISYLGKTGQFKDKVITHQVVDIQKDESGKYVFHSKGLANIIEDPLVSEDQLYGVVTYKSLILSLVYKIIGTKLGILILVVIPILYIIGSEMVSFLLEKEEKRRSKV